MSMLAFHIVMHRADCRALRMSGHYDIAASLESALRQMVAELFEGF